MSDSPKLCLKLSEHDAKEITQFQNFLQDKTTMSRANFYAKYQKYLGLSDEELGKAMYWLLLPLKLPPPPIKPAAAGAP